MLSESSDLITDALENLKRTVKKLEESNKSLRKNNDLIRNGHVNACDLKEVLEKYMRVCKQYVKISCMLLNLENVATAGPSRVPISNSLSSESFSSRKGSDFSSIPLKLGTEKTVGLVPTASAEAKVKSKARPAKAIDARQAREAKFLALKKEPLRRSKRKKMRRTRSCI